MVQMGKDVAVLKDNMDYLKRETKDQGKKIDGISSRIDTIITSHELRLDNLEKNVVDIQNKNPKNFFPFSIPKSIQFAIVGIVVLVVAIITAIKELGLLK